MLRQLIFNRPDIILLDVNLGGMDGRIICKELKLHTDFRNIHIILASASTEKLQLYKGFLADDIIEKPFDVEALIKKIKQLLNMDNSVLK